jgi:signal transduction histidine kinase
VSFRYRLALFLVLMLLAVQAVAALATYSTIRSNLLESAKRQLSTSTSALMRQLDVLGERVGDDVEVLSLDYALRKAVAEHDPATAESALRNFGNRIGAERMLLVGLDGRISVDTAERLASGVKFPFPGLISRAATDDQPTALAVLEDRLYWIVVVPVRAPEPIAFIAACIPVNDVLLNRLAELSTTAESMGLATRSRSGWTMVARTSGYVPGTIDWPTALAGNAPTLINQPSSDHVTMIAGLDTAKGSAPVLAVFDYPLDQALDAYWSVLKPMLLVLAGALTLTLGASLLIARGVSRPLEQLAVAARRIAHGDYEPIPRLGRHDEVADLAAALNGMTVAVAEREAALRNAVVSLDAARNEAVKASHAKSQFLSNMSHELRTPLNAIVGFSELIQRQILGPIGVARYADYARDIHESGMRLVGQFEQMLHLADADAGKPRLACRRFAPGHAVRAAVEILSPAAEQAGVVLDVDGDFASWPVMDGDELKLQRSFANLLDNAVKFSAPGGVVTIRGSCVRQSMKLVIADRGSGIRSEELPLVTRPFHRGNHAFNALHQGAGLGLPFAKSIIEMHGGSLAIESDYGAGTTVTVCLPVLASAELGAGVT